MTMSIYPSTSDDIEEELDQMLKNADNPNFAKEMFEYSESIGISLTIEDWEQEHEKCKAFAKWHRDALERFQATRK